MKEKLNTEEQIKFNKINEIIFGENFLKKFEKGFDTILDTSGLNLSTGQRQRVNLARGLFKENSLIFMDEPTSALDYQTESEILKKFLIPTLLKQQL